jgi:N-acetylneuraminic acid mutarotase
MVVARVNQATAMLADGRVLVVGGRIPTGPIASAEIFDPASRRWSRVADMSVPRESPCATLLADGRVLITGGRTADSATLNATESAELFDPVTGRWSAAVSMHLQRAYHTATRMRDGRVLVTGGAANDSPMAEIYDPRANAWSSAGETPGDGSAASRNGAAAILLPNGKVMVAGGYTSYPTAIQTSILFDPATTAWGLAGQTPGAHPAAIAALLTDGRVLVVGGTPDADLYIPAR